MSRDFEPMLPDPRLPETPGPEAPASLSYPFWNYEDIALFFGMGLPSLVLSVLVMEVIAWFSPLPPNRAVQMLGAQFLGYALWFGSLLLLFRVRYDAPFWPSLAWTMPRQGLGWAVFQGPILAFALGALTVLLRTPPIETPMQELLNDRVSMIGLGVFAVTIGPLCEELAFRGFLMPVLVRSFGTWLGILLTAVPFALLHGPQYSWSWQRLLLLVLAGVAFGRVRQVTGSSAAATMIHASYNLTQFTAAVVAQERGV